MRKRFNELWQRLPIHAWFGALAQREKVVVLCAAWVLAFAGFFLFFLRPAFDFRNAQVELHARELASLQWMEQHQAEASEQHRSGTSSDGRTRLSTVSNSAKMHDIELARFAPSGNNIHLEVRDREFNSVIAWLLTLQQQHAFEIVELRIDRQSPGIVETRVTLR